MKQNIKRLLLVLCMITCFFALSGCAKRVEVPDEIEELLLAAAETNLENFSSYNDEELEKAIKDAKREEKDLTASSLESWKSIKDELGALELDNRGRPVIVADEKTGTEKVAVTETDEEIYEISVDVQFEKRALNFILTAEALEADNGDIILVESSMTFNPVYTIGEKLTKAFMNMVLGMGTVYIVLIFISFLIGRFRLINDWEAGRKAAKEAKKAPAGTPAPAPAPPAPAPAPAAPAVPAPAPMVSAAPAVPEAENLAADLELVAVITAAISAAQNVPAEGLVVRSIRRKSGSNWKKAL